MKIGHFEIHKLGQEGKLLKAVCRKVHTYASLFRLYAEVKEPEALKIEERDSYELDLRKSISAGISLEQKKGLFF